MAKNQLTSPAFRDGEVRRADLCTTVAADAVIAKLVAGTGVSISQTGAAAGTGDVTVNVAGVPIVDDTTTNATMYPMWVTATTGALPPKVSSTKITFNPSTGLLSLAGGIAVGNLTANPGAGNLSIGAVPSTAFGSSLAAIIMGNANIITPKTIAANNYFYLSNNMLFDGGVWRSVSTDAGSTYFQQNGFHAWATAVSVTAGSTQTFVERMRLHLSGGLSLGSATDPGAGVFKVEGSTTNSTFRVGTIEFQGYGLNNCWFGDNVYFNGSDFKARATGESGLFYFAGREAHFRFYTSNAAGTTLNFVNSVHLKINANGSVGLGGGIQTNVDSFAGAAMVVKLGVIIGGTTDPGTGVLKVEGSTSNSTFRVGSMEFQAFGLNNVWFGDNHYYDGSNMKYRFTGYAGAVRWFNGQTTIHNFASGSAGANFANPSAHQIKCDSNGHIGFGSLTDITVGVFTGAVMVIKTGVIIGGTTDPGANEFSVVNRFSTNAVRVGFVVPVQLKLYTVATLPTGALGDTAIVSDSNTAVFAANVASGGANKVPVYHDGTQWKVG